MLLLPTPKETPLSLKGHVTVKKPIWAERGSPQGQAQYEQKMKLLPDSKLQPSILMNI